MESLLQAAQQYVNMGFSVVAANSDKATFAYWRIFQQRFPDDKELREMFCHPHASNLALICGNISGGLEVLDFDLKYDVSGNLFRHFGEKLRETLPHLAKQLVVARSRSGGYHIFYRCSQVSGNRKLAQRETTPEEKIINPKEKRKVLIETRGEAGIIIVAPSPGYTFVRGQLSDIPVLTPIERDTLLGLAVSLNQVKLENRQPVLRQNNISYSHSPFEDYNNRGDIVGLLEKHGWKVVRTTPQKTYFLRPGQTKSRSSGDYHHEKGLFSVFTSSSEFEPNTGYKPSTVFAILECDGNFKLAAKMLLGLGYGRSYQQVQEQRQGYSRGRI